MKGGLGRRTSTYPLPHYYCVQSVACVLSFPRAFRCVVSFLLRGQGGRPSVRDLICLTFPQNPPLFSVGAVSVSAGCRGDQQETAQESAQETRRFVQRARSATGKGECGALAPATLVVLFGRRRPSAAAVAMRCACLSSYVSFRLRCGGFGLQFCLPAANLRHAYVYSLRELCGSQFHAVLAAP